MLYFQLFWKKKEKPIEIKLRNPVNKYRFFKVWNTGGYLGLLLFVCSNSKEMESKNAKGSHFSRLWFFPRIWDCNWALCGPPFFFKGRFLSTPVVPPTWSGKGKIEDMDLVRLSFSGLCSDLLQRRPSDRKSVWVALCISTFSLLVILFLTLIAHLHCNKNYLPNGIEQWSLHSLHW